VRRHLQNPSTHAFPPVHATPLVGSHSEPSVVAVPQIAYAVAPTVTILQTGVAVRAAHALAFGAAHDV
jgi:hypothetical protein